MKDRHWNSLVATLRYGHCVLVLGPEIPAFCEASSRPEHVSDNEATLNGLLARELAAELEEDNQKPVSSTLAAICQQYEDSDGFGATALRATVERFYGNAEFEPSLTHLALAKLPFSLVLTTCHDTLLSRAFKQMGKEPIIQRYHLRGDRRDNPEFMVPHAAIAPVIYHLFGIANEPYSLALSENDLLDFMLASISGNPPLPNSLLRALKQRNQSYLFVGFGIRHWQMRMLLKIIMRMLEMGRSGSAIAAESLHDLLPLDRNETILFYQRGMRVEVEDLDVIGFLDILTKKLGNESHGLPSKIESVRAAKVFISYAREDYALAIRVQQSLLESKFEPWLDTSDLKGGEDWDLRIKSELSNSDFVLVLYTPALACKTDGYVNVEINLARMRSLHVRGSFLIPLRTEPPNAMERIPELEKYQDMELRAHQFDEDFRKLISFLTREIQRRNR
jgi:hypothetical protein